MQPPDIPENEDQRLAALLALDILDTAAEERFDRYTRLACRLLDVPIALVSLVDERRQWFKSRQGLDATETPREISFCGHTINGRAAMIVPDAAKDPRFSDNPLVTGSPDIRFYAGVPLTDAAGNTFGTLCVIDRKPRILDNDALRALTDLAALVEGELTALDAASTDSLTGLRNRAGFVSQGRRTLAEAQLRGLPVALVYVDLDDFKCINDTHGHAVGDDALREVAHLLRRTFRDDDLIGRLGGDEFVVLAHVATHRGPSAMVDRFMTELDQRNADTRRPYALRASAGAVVFNQGLHGNIEGLLNAADARMYACKKVG